MSDLVKRLRAWAQDLRVGRNCMGADQDLETAADRIEALERENKELNLEIIAAHGQAQDAYETAKLLVRREALEEAVREAELCAHPEPVCDWDEAYAAGANGAAAAIRKLMEKKDE